MDMDSNSFQLAWVTDIHLNFLEPEPLEAFLSMLEKRFWDALLITGDIAEAVDCSYFLKMMQTRLKRPIYFVLGNHDYYYGSLEKVRSSIYHLHMENLFLNWLPCSGVVHLTADTALVGHDGWADARYGDFINSIVIMNDHLLVKELADCFHEEEKTALQKKLQSLGDEVAEYFRHILPKALERYEHVILATHIPPFPEICVFEEGMDENDWLPHLCCKAVGEELIHIMEQYPHNQLTVLCGHTHSFQCKSIIPNIQVFSGSAEYGSPELQKIFDIRYCTLNYA